MATSLPDPAIISAETNRMRLAVVEINQEMNDLIVSVQALSQKCEMETDIEVKVKLTMQLEESMNVLKALKDASTAIMDKLDYYCEMGTKFGLTADDDINAGKEEEELPE